MVVVCVISVSAVHSSDLVLEDTLDSGETYVGDGRSGLFGNARDKADDMMNYNRPKSSKLRGMSGPISSNLDVSIFSYDEL